MKTKYLYALLLPLLLSVMVTPVAFAECDPEPPDNHCNGTGYTPGFWKHNIRVALELTRGSYSAFDDGTKVTEVDLLTWAGDIGVSLEEALEDLTARGPGSEATRTDMANAFNAAAGFGPFED
jgi:hypothetical protein